jgi:hypothetical protein
MINRVPFKFTGSCINCSATLFKSSKNVLTVVRFQKSPGNLSATGTVAKLMDRDISAENSPHECPGKVPGFQLVFFYANTASGGHFRGKYMKSQCSLNLGLYNICL